MSKAVERKLRPVPGLNVRYCIRSFVDSCRGVAMCAPMLIPDECMHQRIQPHQPIHSSCLIVHVCRGSLCIYSENWITRFTTVTDPVFSGTERTHTAKMKHDNSVSPQLGPVLAVQRGPIDRVLAVVVSLCPCTSTSLPCTP